MRQPAQRRKELKPKEKSASKKPAGKSNRPQPQRPAPSAKEGRAKDVDSSGALAAADIPVPLQQLLLNIFKTAFVLWPDAASSHDDCDTKPAFNPEEEEEERDSSTGQLIQTLKSHLYRRDFASAFADASGDLLRVYALRWSAGRALGYAGIFNTVLDQLCWRQHEGMDDLTLSPQRLAGLRQHILCIGGGAGAEIVALAAVLRRVTTAHDEENAASSKSQTGNRRLETDLTSGISNLSLNDGRPGPEITGKESITATPASTRDNGLRLSVTAVDIADWNPVVKGLSEAIFANSVPSIKSCPAPLLSRTPENEDRFAVSFRKEDVLSLSEEGLQSLLFPADQEQHGASPTPPPGSAPTLVTLMFTLNELFSTSMPKAVSMLLKLTELARPGTILLVVDSPGSYSTVSIGSKSSKTSSDANKADEEAKPAERKYPMRFLLEHTLLSVAAGRWECVLSDESRWFRRDRAALKYHVGEGIGLEDMRYQIHVYRRTTEG